MNPVEAPTDGESIVQRIMIPVTTVAKIVLISALGLYISQYFEHGKNTIKGFTYISVRILLPCMLFANLCLQVTWSNLGRYYWAPLMSLVPIVLGYTGALFFRRFLDKGYHGVITLGCTFQNGLIFPLSVLLNLKGVPWLVDDALDSAQQMMFLYNIIPSIGLWAIGEPLIRNFKRKLDMEESVQTQELDTAEHGEAMEHTFAPKSEPLTADANTPQNVTQQWSHLPAATASPTRQQTSTPVGHSRPPAVESSLKTLKEALGSPPVAASLMALLISLTLPLRILFNTPPGQVLIGGLKIVGNGCIPLQLLVLGCTLNAGSTSLSTATSRTVEQIPPGETYTEMVSTEDGLWDRFRRAVREVSQATRFTVLTCVLRLLLLPACSFLIVHLLVVTHLMPREKPFLLSLLIGISSPAAINSSLICTMYNYRAQEYARMILIMYVCATGTATLWLMLDLWYVGKYGE